MFQQNKKMKKASVVTYNFSLPAVKTCPGAGACAYGQADVSGLSAAERLAVADREAFCFAYLEEKRYPSARAYRERMLALATGGRFVETVNAELAALLAKRSLRGKQIAIRVHASGDFFSPQYLLDWFNVAEQNPNVLFYAYTKSVWFKRLAHKKPANFVLIYSLGGSADHLIDTENDRHSRIFATVEEAIAAGYTPASEDDAQAWSAPSPKIGLVMFGARKNKGNATLGNESCSNCPIKAA